MAKIIDVPNFGQVEFPDGMSDSDIESAIKRNAMSYRPQEQKTPSPADDIGPFQAGLISTGREFDKVGKTLQSGWAKLTGNSGRLAEIAAEDKAENAAFAELEQRHPAATALGAMAPYLAIPAGAGSRLVGRGLTTVAPRIGQAIAGSQIADGAIIGALSGAARYGTDTSALSGAAGGAAGGAIAQGIGKLISPNLNRLSPSQSRIAGEAQALGARMTPGQATGSDLLRRIEAGMQSYPITSGPFSAVKAGNQALLNRSAAKAIGETAEAVSDDVLSQAQQRLSGVYKLVADDTKVPLGQGFASSLGKVIQDSDGVLLHPLDADPMFAKVMERAQAGEASRRELQSLASKLGQRVRNLMRSDAGDRDMGIALGHVKDAVDDALEGSLNGQTKVLFRDARSQYRNLMTLMRPGVTNEQSGDVSGAMLANTLRRTDKSFRFNRDGAAGDATDMRKLARFAKAFPDIVGDSGTATRMAVPLLTGGLGGATIAGMAGGDPMAGAQYGLSAVAAPFLLSRAYMHPATTHYLQNNLMGNSPIASEALKRLGNSAPVGLLGQP